MQPLFLVGFMGAGKTTVGHAVAADLDRPFTDLDDLIELRTGRTVDDLFAETGEDGFREQERAALQSLVGRADAVVACGGGIVTDDASRGLLAGSGDVVYLQVSPDEALVRISGQLHGRPLLQGADPAGAAALLGLRERLYEEVADFSVDTVGCSPAEIAERIVSWVVLQP